MKKRYFSRLSSLVLCIILCVSLISCSGDGGTASETEQSDSEIVTEPPSTEAETEKVLLHGDNPDNAVWAEAYLKALPTRNFDGATFFITSADTTMLDPDGVSFVSETVAKRNAALEEKYSISVRSAKADTATMASEAEKAINAGLYYTDVMAVPFEDTGAFAVSGLLTNLRSMPLLDLSQPYFNASSVNALSAGYNIYGVAGEATPATLDLPVVVFNKSLIQKMSGADLYSEALSGEFTWDRFFEIASLADTSAEAGAVCTAGKTSEYIFASVGGRFVISGEKTVPYVGFANYSMNNAATCLRTIFAKAELSKITPGMAPATFASGRALLSICSMRELDKYRTEAVEMGILPMPKLTVEDNYRSLVGGDALILTVTKGSTNSEMVSLALSGLCAASYGYITEEYVDYLHAATLPDNRSAEVLELISKSAYYDLSVAFGASVPGLRAGTGELVSSIMETGDFSNFDALTSEANSALSAAFPLSN